MERNKMPKPGEIYNHFKDKPYQIITVATNTETRELMVVYQALYGDFKTYVRPLEMFMSEVDNVKFPEAIQKYRFELRNSPFSSEEVNTAMITNEDNRSDNYTEKPEPIENLSISSQNHVIVNEQAETEPVQEVNAVLMKFLDAESYSKKLEIISSNMKHMNDRLINDMAVSLDCAVDEGPLDQRIHGLLYCLQAMCRFEDRRLR
jgi:hypothetical protein